MEEEEDEEDLFLAVREKGEGAILAVKGSCVRVASGDMLVRFV